MDIDTQIKEHFRRITALAHALQPITEKVVVVGASAVLLHWLHTRKGQPLMYVEARPTTDIDIAVQSPDLARELVSEHKELVLQALCPLSADDGRRGVGFLPHIKFAFEDFITVRLKDELTIRAAGAVALYVLKLEAITKPYRAKKDSDMRDLYFLLNLYGEEPLATMCLSFAGRNEVISSLRRLKKLLAHELAPGYKLLFEEMNLPFPSETWVIARFDRFFYELTQAGFSLE